MRLRLSALWTAARLAVAFARLKTSRTTQPGLNTEADAAAFIAEMHHAGHLAPDDDDEPTPIFDALNREFPNLLAARRRALRQETIEMRATFADIVSRLEIEWLCQSCDAGRDGERQHQSCAGCPCPCAMVGVGT